MALSDCCGAGAKFISGCGFAVLTATSLASEPFDTPGVPWTGQSAIRETTAQVEARDRLLTRTGPLHPGRRLKAAAPAPSLNATNSPQFPPAPLPQTQQTVS